MKQPLRVGTRLFAQAVEIGALSQLCAATDPKAKGGQFIGPDGRGESRGYPTIVRPDRGAWHWSVAR